MTKTVDNFELLAQALFPEGGEAPEGEFYFVQILVRGKDGNNVNGNNRNRLVRYYVVRSATKLLEIKPEVEMLCKLHNARAYIHPSPRSDKDVAAEMLKAATDEFVKGNYHVFRRLYSTACGRTYVPGKKLFIVDLDGKAAEESGFVKCLLFRCRGSDALLKKTRSGKTIDEATPLAAGEYAEKVLVEVPTKSGKHLVCVPFDVGQFEQGWKEDDILNAYPVPDVHKNNPTVLWCQGE